MINNHVLEVQKFTRDTIWTFSGLGFRSLVGLVIVALLTRSFQAELLISEEVLLINGGLPSTCCAKLV